MHPISEVLCRVYSELHSQGQVKFALQQRQRDAVDSVVKTVNTNYFGFHRYATVEEKAVAYLYFLIKNHPLMDGNKRLAVFWFSVYCETNKLEYSTRYTLDRLAVAIERTPSSEKEQIMDFLIVLLFGERKDI